MSPGPVPGPRPQVAFIQTRHDNTEPSRLRPPSQPEDQREKSPKSVLREAKKKLRTNANIKYGIPSEALRDKSPASVLREAKMRLRKLQLEAEAAEESYRSFRRRRDRRRDPEPVRSKSLQRVDHSPNDASPDIIKENIDKYLQEYKTKFGFCENRFYNRNLSTAKIKPIPDDFSNREPDIKDFIETPLLDFRKYYQSDLPMTPQLRYANNDKQDAEGPINLQSPVWSPEVLSPSLTPDKEIVLTPERRSPLRSPEQRIKSPLRNNDENYLTGEVSDITYTQIPEKGETNESDRQNNELQILKSNLNRMYDLNSNDVVVKLTDQEINMNEMQTVRTCEIENNNEVASLRIEVENVNEVSEVGAGGAGGERDLVVVVHSSLQAEPPQPERGRPLTGNMTIIISPKRSTSDKSVDREQFRQDDVFEAIYKNNLKLESSVEGQPFDSKDRAFDTGSDEKDNSTDFDFSADVDNYESDTSPISHKSLVGDNMWS